MDKDIQNQVVAIFGEGNFYCAETALKLIAEAGGVDPKPYIPLATGFCSGASRTCGQCGAVSGAIMGIGLFAGRSEPKGDYEDCYSLVQEFVERFDAKCGSLNCHELIKCDFATKEGQERFVEKKLISECVQYVAFAVETAVELLQEGGFIPVETA